MITENLSTLKIHKLSQKQYDRELAAGNIDENAIYLTPDDSATGSVTDQIYDPESENAQSGKAVAEGISKEIKDKISMWQPNTYYKVGNYCIASQVSGVGNNKADYKHFLYRCKVEHTSSEDIHYDSGSYWDRFDIIVDQSAKDGLGNFIVDTYATKDELTEAIGEALEGDY